MALAVNILSCLGVLEFQMKERLSKPTSGEAETQVL
jgi:hypothetical protein